ncbi:MAG: PglZ domain-containing protein [Azospirillum sp.]|nr:PglZ domain-containing protein [Azospirillum sp.]
MAIRDFIRDQIFTPPLQRRGVLVVYDPDRRYHALCLAMAGPRVTVVDAGVGSIAAREAAMTALAEVAAAVARPHELLIYIPKRRPITDLEKQVDPFSAYSTFGAVFPDGDGHDYLNLCLRAVPDQQTEIRKLFADDPSPSFEVIDGVGGGAKWPTLNALLGTASAREILLALLVPTAAQKAALQGAPGWVPEARALFEATLGLKLMTKGKTWSAIADELWRSLLFSEFSFDLPGALPPALAGVPHAPTPARATVADLCDSLRSDKRFRHDYVARAIAVEGELGMVAACRDLAELGERDTFPFEERSFLAAAGRAFKADRLDQVRTIADRHGNSVWAETGESQLHWGLLRSVLALAEACADGERQLSDHVCDINALIEYYVASLRRVDQLQRELEQAVGDQVVLDGPMAEAVEQVRGSYGRLMANVAGSFTRHLEKTGWPPAGRIANADVFDRYVGPCLKENGGKVGYILVDALRYELGVALLAQLAEGNTAEIIPACAQLPTITLVGMASLLPGAAGGLSLAADNGAIVPVLDGTPLQTVGQRMEYLRRRYGDRFAERTLSAFVADKGTLPGPVSLLVLRDTEIDSHLEANPESTLGQLQLTLRRIRIAIARLRDAGFQDVIIATDHGFVLNAYAGAGDICAKPPGTWIELHGRSLLGEGAADGTSFVVPAGKVGIRGDFGCFAGPRSLAPYRHGLRYFHGGASLQEAVVPILVVRLKKQKPTSKFPPSVVLSYRNGAKRITTRVPVFEVSVTGGDLFSHSDDIEVLLEARNKQGEVIGEPKVGGLVNAVTRTMMLRPGQKERVTIKMAVEFEGKFVLKAMNPTTMASYGADLELETDYV